MPVYEILGLPSTTAYPGSRAFSVHVIDDTDHVLVFGGLTGPDPTRGAMMNDLWRLDMLLGTWTVSGA